MKFTAEDKIRLNQIFMKRDLDRANAEISRVREQRKAFEQWYTLNAFDYESAPIGSRDCELQWKAWQAAKQDEAIA